jgi:hypothetical protein
MEEHHGRPIAELLALESKRAGAGHLLQDLELGGLHGPTL